MHGGATANVVSRSVRDSAIMLDAIQGPEIGGPYPMAPPKRSFASEVGRAPKALKIALCTSSPIGTDVHPECVKAATDAAKLLESLGHHVEEAAPPIDGDALADDFLSIYFAMAASAVAATKAETGCGNDGFELDTLAACTYVPRPPSPPSDAIAGRLKDWEWSVDMPVGFECRDGAAFQIRITARCGSSEKLLQRPQR
jgi:amidase